MMNRSFRLDVRDGDVLSMSPYQRGWSRKDRAIAQNAGNAANTAGTTAGQYGATASGIAANLVPALTRQMNNPQGFSQRDTTAQLAAAQAGTGGATAGLTGAADKNGAVTRNPMGFSAALDAAARQRDKGNAMAGEKVAANNANVKIGQQQDAQKGLEGLYGTAGKLQTESASNQTADILAQLKAKQQGWIQNWDEINKDIGGSVKDAQEIM